MMQPNKPIPIPIDRGSRPDYNVQLGYPNLFNMFVGKTRHAYCTPSLQPLVAMKNIRDFIYSPFNGGRYFVVTNTAVSNVSKQGAISPISEIVYSGLDVVICMNQNNQIAFCDGRYGYIYNQTDGKLTRLDSVASFVIKNPVSVCQINNFFVWLGADGTFQNSFPNNGLLYNPLQTAKISGNLTSAISIATLTNNLYIFGSTGIERWEAITSNLYDFPFTKDPNFRADFGAYSSNSVINAINNIYFLSSKRVPMRLSAEGLVDITSEQDLSGFSNIISAYPDADKKNVFSSFYSFNGNYFYSMTFLSTGISWVYCENSDTLSQGDDLIIAAAQNNEVVATTEGLFNLSTITSYKHRQIVSDRLVRQRNLSQSWNLLNGVECKIIQGELQSNDTQILYLSLSIDSKSWLNSMPMDIGRAGERGARTIWQTNLGFPYSLMAKIDYYGDYPLVIDSIEANIK